MSYTVREVSAMLGLSAAQIRSFASKGFLQPERGPRGELRFGFLDLVVVSDGGAVWNPESGQVLFDFSVEELAERTQMIPRPSDEVEELYEVACEIESSSPEQAKDVYQRLLQLDPDHIDAHVNLGRLLHEEGAPAAAERHYRRAVEL